MGYRFEGSRPRVRVSEEAFQQIKARVNTALGVTVVTAEEKTPNGKHLYTTYSTLGERDTLLAKLKTLGAKKIPKSPYESQGFIKLKLEGVVIKLVDYTDYVEMMGG
jgi:hypothetical protein